MTESVDSSVAADDWSRLSQFREMPDIDVGRMRTYRLRRIREQMRKREVDLAILINPLSVRYAADVRECGLFQSRLPIYYLFLPLEGPVVMHSGFPSQADEYESVIDEYRPAQDINVFNAGPDLQDRCRLFAEDVSEFLRSIGADQRRVAIEHVTPAVVQGMMQRDMEILDAVSLVEEARYIKSADELECMRWSIAVAEHAMAKMHDVLAPGMTENQLWGLLNYANLANNGDWHDTRMLASGPRSNPWFQEASEREIQAGELVGFDTDMIGPFGYMADVSRTYYCEPGTPTGEQRNLYQRAYEEIQYNMDVLKVGMTLKEFAEKAFKQPEDFLRYSSVSHAVGMSDEFPRVPFIDQWETKGSHCVFEPGMVMCIESYVGKKSGGEGVKLEEQVLIGEQSNECLTSWLCCKLVEEVRVVSGSPHVSALARPSCSHTMASLRAHGPTPKARSTILASPTMPSCRAKT